MSVQEIIAELPKLSDDEREMILRKLVNLDEDFEPTPAMEEAIREGLRSLNQGKTYSAAEVRSRIASWTAP
jgi:predicted transcriptional regulator